MKFEEALKLMREGKKSYNKSQPGIIYYITEFELTNVQNRKVQFLMNGETMKTIVSKQISLLGHVHIEDAYISNTAILMDEWEILE